MQLEIRYADLLEFNPDLTEAKAEIMVKTALARAKQIAPHLHEPLDQDVVDAASGIILRAVIRWDAVGSGALTQESQSVGAFSQSHSTDNRETSKVLFFPSEIEELKALGPVKITKGKAFSIDLAPDARVPQRSLWE